MPDIKRSAGQTDSFFVKQIIIFARQRDAAEKAGMPLPSVGRGVALAIGLLLLTLAFSVIQNQVWNTHRVRIIESAHTSLSSFGERWLLAH